MQSFLSDLARYVRTTKMARPTPRTPRRAYLQVDALEDRLMPSATSALPGFVTNELHALQTSINQQLLGKALPLVGSALNDLGGSAVGSFEQAIIDGATAAIGGNMQAVQAAITKDLGSPGLGSILQSITPTSDGKGDFNVLLHLHDNSVLSTGNVDLNLALPGLPIQFAAHNAAVNVQVGYDIELEFGMQSGTPFLKTVANPSDTANPRGVALNINAQIAPGSSISATLGGLTATLTQPVAPPLNADVARHAVIGHGVPTVPAPSLSNFEATLDFGFSVTTNGGIQIATPQLTGAANVDLQAALSMGNNPTLPSVTAGLTVNWAFNSANPSAAGLLGNAPTVSFTNVTVDLGSFLSNVVEPVVSAVQQFTQPLETVAKVLTSPLPAITDVTSFLGVKPITLATLLGGRGSSLQTFADTVEFINGLQIPTTGSITVDVGSFNITDARAANSRATNFAENTAVQQKGLLGAVGGQVQSTYSSLQTKADVDFPVLDNPMSFVSSVLLGQQVYLVKATLGADFSAGINANIPVFGPLGINFEGSLSVNAGATFVLTDGLLAGGSLLNSLQVQNAHVDVGFQVGAGASLDAIIASASLDGTVGVTFDLGLTNKTTGSTTFTGSDLLDGNVAFNISQAQLQAGVQFEIDALGISGSVDIPVFTENLITGSITGGGGGGSGPGGGGGGPGGGSGGHTVLN